MSHYKQFGWKRKIWFNVFRMLSFLGRENTLKLQKFIKFFFGLTDDKAIRLEFCSFCNVRCAWCWMYYDSVNKPVGMMKYENFQRFMELNSAYLFKNNIRIAPFFNGETLLHPQIMQIFEDISENKLTMGGLHTNLSINIDVEKLMSFPIARFIINIGGITKDIHEKVMQGSNFNLVISNVKKMISINKNIIFLKINPTKHNIHQLKNLKKFMIDLGGYPQNTIISSTGFSLPSLATKEEKEEFFSKVISEDMIKYLRFAFKINKKGDITILPKKRSKTCGFLMDAICFDGRFTVCCHDQLGKINLGNAFKTPIETIKNSSEYKKIYQKAKTKSFDFCKDCN